MSSKQKKILIALLIVGALALGAIFSGWKKGKKVSYREVVIETGSITRTITATGSVKPENRLVIKAPIPGRMEEVLVKEGQWVKKGQILAWMSSNERAALLDSARSQNEEELKRWEEMVRPAPIVAPIDGTLILRGIEPGQSFAITDEILVMSDRLTVKAQVDETDIAEIKRKQDAEITLDAYSHEKIPAKVDQVAFEAKTQNNVSTYIVDVLPLKTPDFFRSGMTANVVFYIENKENALIAPSEAVRKEEGRSFVLVRGVDGKPVEKTVTTGISDGKRVDILEGLKVGDKVLIDESDSLDAKKSTGSSPFTPSFKRPPGGRPR